MVRPEELLQYENELRAKGYKLICGIDEVGRGPLAGPVTCTAVIMDLDNLIVGVNDSKKFQKVNVKNYMTKSLKKLLQFQPFLTHHNKLMR